jgi:molecular chaperone Hsp33
MEMNSSWSKWLSQPGNIRAVSLDATELMRELCAQHKLAGIAPSGFSEAVIGAMLLSSSHKIGESINVNVQGSGYFKQAIVDASPDGRVRGFMIEQSDPSMRTFGVDGNAGPWGTGILSVLYTKSHEGKVPYTGMVPVSTGILDDAFNEYYKDSEQRTSRMGIAIELKGSEVALAHGALIQVLGGASEEEHHALGKVTTAQLRLLAKDSGNFKTNLDKLIPGHDFRQVETSEVASFCNCNQDRIERALILAGEQDMIDALGTDPMLNVSCDFCRKEYKVSAERLKALYTKDRTRLQ